MDRTRVVDVAGVGGCRREGGQTSEREHRRHDDGGKGHYLERGTVGRSGQIRYNRYSR